jgi:5'(3')-deoxyribonucleotidase
MAKPVLAVDFDDVVAGFNAAFVQYHNEQFGTAITYEGIYTYDMPLLYGSDIPTNHRRVMEFCHYYHDQIEPIEGALENLRKLKKRYRLEIVTSRCESIRRITFGWNRVRAPRLFAAAHFTNGFATRFPERRRSKLEVCNTIGAVALVDDAVSHANEVAEGGISVFLPTRPWNKEAELHEGVIRVTDWDEITKQLLS